MSAAALTWLPMCWLWPKRVKFLAFRVASTLSWIVMAPRLMLPPACTLAVPLLAMMPAMTEMPRPPLASQGAVWVCHVKRY